MAQLTRRQVLTATGGGLAAVAVVGVTGHSVLRVLMPTLGLRDLSQATAFGRVAVLGARREHRSGVAGSHHGSNASGAGSDHLAPEHQPWAEIVRADIEVENLSRRPVLLSPGQFRLRVGETGPTVSLYEAGHRVLALAGGTVLTTWVGFLVPPEESSFAIEYTEAGAATPHAFQIVPEVIA
jgi:hypothetical protein